jgi:hypothetical protein
MNGEHFMQPPGLQVFGKSLVPTQQSVVSMTPPVEVQRLPRFAEPPAPELVVPELPLPLLLAVVAPP